MPKACFTSFHCFHDLKWSTCDCSTNAFKIVFCKYGSQSVLFSSLVLAEISLVNTYSVATENYDASLVECQQMHKHKRTQKFICGVYSLNLFLSDSSKWKVLCRQSVFEHERERTITKISPGIRYMYKMLILDVKNLNMSTNHAFWQDWIITEDILKWPYLFSLH